MFSLTILHRDGTTTHDRLNRVNDSEGSAIQKFTQAVEAWELEKTPDNRAVFLTNGTVTIRRWENPKA